jgi:hypothetical protein
MIKHILLTRFNVVTNYSVNREPPTTEWLLNRLEIFKKLTLPSIEAQIIQPDLWLVFVDRNSPTVFLNELKLLLCRNDYNYELCFCDIFNSEFIVNVIRRNLTENDKWVLTSRVDNDDGLHPNFIKKLQENIVLQTGFMNITSGLIFTDKKAYRKNDYSNAFISLLEPVDNLSSVFVVDHINARDFANVKQIDLKDGWLQYVHGENVSNQIRGVRVSSSCIDANVKNIIPTDFKYESNALILFDNTILILFRYGKSLYRRFKFELNRLKNSTFFR